MSVIFLLRERWNYLRKNRNEHGLFCGISNALSFLDIQNFWCCQHKVMKDNLLDLIFLPKYMRLPCFKHYSDSLKPLLGWCAGLEKNLLQMNLDWRNPGTHSESVCLWYNTCDIHKSECIPISMPLLNSKKPTWKKTTYTSKIRWNADYILIVGG